MADENIVNGKKYKVLQNGIWKILSFFTKASDVTFDDGMNAEEKIQEIEKNGFGIEITQSDYDKLSEEEKNNGVYWVTDGNGGGGGGSIDPTLSIEGMAADAKAVGDTKISYTDVVDNLTSTSTNLPLSANQGKVLDANVKKCLQIVSFSGGTLTTKSF